MKKIFTNPELRIRSFMKEQILAASSNAADAAAAIKRVSQDTMITQATFGELAFN